MVTDELLLEYGIQPDSLVGRLEKRMSDICEELSKKRIPVDLGKLKTDLADMDARITELTNQMQQHTNGMVTTSDLRELKKQLSRFLVEERGIPSFFLNDEGVIPSLLGLLSLLDRHDSVLFNIFGDFWKTNQRRRYLKGLLKEFDAESNMVILRYNSLYGPPMEVVGVKPDLKWFFYRNYLHPSSGKVWLEVGVKDFSLYALGHLLESEELKEIYYQGGYDLFGEMLTSVPRNELSSDDKYQIASFLNSILNTQYKLRVEGSLKEFFPSVGTTEDSRRLLMLLRNVDVSQIPKEQTPIGRKLAESITFNRYLCMLYNDLQRLALVYLSDNFNLRPYMILQGVFIFELHEDANIQGFQSQIEQAYHESRFQGWEAPVVFFRTKETT